MGGWRKLPDDRVDSPLWSEADTWRLYCWVLRRSNYRVGYYYGRRVEPGQLITSSAKIEAATGWDRSKVRRELSKLESHGAITLESTNRYTVITLVDEATCDEEDTPDRPSRDHQQTSTLNDFGDETYGGDQMPESSDIDHQSRNEESSTGHNSRYPRSYRSHRHIDPPPTPSRGWGEVEEDLIGLGLGDASGAIRGAIERGISPDQARAVIAHYRGHPSAWGPGALHRRLITAVPTWAASEGWPEASSEYQADQTARDREARERAEREADAERRRQREVMRSAAERERIEREERYGPIVDAMSDEEHANVIASLGEVVAGAYRRCAATQRRERYRRDVIDTLAARDGPLAATG